jgi:hypothetical protein
VSRLVLSISYWQLPLERLGFIYSPGLPRGSCDVLQFVHYQFTQINMPKVTLTNEDGSTTDFFPQSYTDAAVAAVSNATGPNMTITDSGVTITHADGSTQSFVPAA